jgi:uncharacterized protein
MAVLYFEARKKTTDLNAFERSRTNWILQKRTCESDIACLERSYLQRIAVLEQISQMASSSTSALASSAPTGQGWVHTYKWHWRCHKHEQSKF